MHFYKLVLFLSVHCIGMSVKNFCSRQPIGPDCTCKPKSGIIHIYCRVTSLGELRSLPHCNDTSRSKHLKIFLDLMTHLPSSALNCSNVSSLYVSGDHLASMDRDAFNGLEQTLRRLYLEHSNLRELPTAAIDGLAGLRVLRLENNRITDFNLTLRDFNLETLSLSDNQISIIEPNTFPKTLKFLDLTNNKIAGLNLSLAEGLPQLTTLYISKNDIHDLEKRLNNLPSLKTLAASHNLIRYINDGDLSGLSNLEILDLSSNRIYHLLRGFKGLSRLYMLDLRNNRLRCLTVDSLSDLTSLGILDISNNDIWSLQDGALYCLSSLRLFDISDNSLRNINFFNSLLEPVNFNMTGDSRERSKNVTSCVFRGYSNLKSLIISGNFIPCDIDTQKIVRMLNSRGVSITESPCRPRG